MCWHSKSNFFSLCAIFIILNSKFNFNAYAGVKSAYKIECNSIGSDGQITLDIWDNNRGYRYTYDEAQKDAIQAILYAGITGNSNCFHLPPMLNDIEEQQKFKTIKKEFFSKKGSYLNYTRNSAMNDALPKTMGKKNFKVYRIVIDQNTLRKYLEQKNVIKRMTTGF